MTKYVLPPAVSKPIEHPGGHPDEELKLPYLKVRKMSDVELRPVNWLWPNRFASGKLNILAGNPGLGKSHLSIDFAARVTTGNRFPDTSARCEFGSVLILSAEDDAEDTIAPRLHRAGADLSKVIQVQATRSPSLNDGTMRDRSFNFADDLPLLESTIQEIGDVKLLIVDPLSAYLGKTDSHRDADVRGTLQPLADLLQRSDICGLGIMHMNKAGGTKSAYRVSGSLAFVAASRTVWLWVEDVDKPGRLLMLQVKNNLAVRQDGLACQIMSDERGSYLAWEAGTVAMNADGYLDAESDKSANNRDDSSLREAEAFVTEYLASGPVASKELDDAAKANGISAASVQRARKSLKCKASKHGGTGKWMVSLPQSSQHEFTDQLDDF